MAFKSNICRHCCLRFDSVLRMRVADIKKVGESLYVMNWLGMLTEYVLMPHVKTGVEKVSDDSPVDMTYAIKAQWPLHRCIEAVL